MKCKDCKFWQGHRHSEWADCYRVIAQIDENIICQYMTDDYGAITKFFGVPFDPHEVKYWRLNEQWAKIYDGICKAQLPPGVRMIEETRDDIMYDAKGGEALGRLKAKYFQTHKDYECKGEFIEEQNTDG